MTHRAAAADPLRSFFFISTFQQNAYFRHQSIFNDKIRH